MRAGDTIWNRFAIESLVSVGGTAAVFRALDQETGQRVALKVLQSDAAPSAVRFDREAGVLAELEHPGLVRHIAHGIAESGAAFLAMEWLEGEELQHRLVRGRLDVAETLRLATRLAEALALVHARGVVHRDLNPGNIFLVDNRVDAAKLLDFGIARFGTGPATQAGVVLGTLGYIAPEQAETDQPIDCRTDVFALGCVLYACLTGVPPYAGARLTEMVESLRSAAPPRVGSLRTDMPPELDTLVAGMLSKDPASRPPDGAAVALALRAVLASEAERQQRGAGQSTRSDPREDAEVLLQEAERALRQRDLEGARTLAVRGLGAAPRPKISTDLLGLLCEVLVRQGNGLRASQSASEVLRLATPGDVPWVRAMLVRFAGALAAHSLDEVLGTLAALRRPQPTAEAIPIMAFALGVGCLALDSEGRFAQSKPTRDCLHRIVEPLGSRHPAARGWLHLAETKVAAWLNEDPWGSLKLAESARAAFEEAGDARGVLFAQVNVGMNLWNLGVLPAAERVVRGTVTMDFGFGLAGEFRDISLVHVLAERGHLAEAHALALAMVEAPGARGGGAHPGAGRWMLGEVLAEEGDLEGAERELLAAMDALQSHLLYRSAATGSLAKVLVRKANYRAARSAANDALSRYGVHGAFGFRGMTAWLALAEALQGMGEREEAMETIAGIRARILKQASRIGERDLRESFVNEVPDNRRALTLARTWFEESR